MDKQSLTTKAEDEYNALMQSVPEFSSDTLTFNQLEKLTKIAYNRAREVAESLKILEARFDIHRQGNIESLKGINEKMEAMSLEENKKTISDYQFGSYIAEFTEIMVKYGLEKAIRDLLTILGYNVE